MKTIKKILSYNWFYWGPRTQSHPRGNPIFDLVHTLKFKVMIRLIRNYAETDMDQWDRFELQTKYGKLFVSIDSQGDGYTYRKIPEDR